MFEASFPYGTTNHKHYPFLRRNTSPVWNPQMGKPVGRRLMWTVSSGYSYVSSDFCCFQALKRFVHGFHRFTEHNCKTMVLTGDQFYLRVYTNLTLSACWSVFFLLLNKHCICVNQSPVVQTVHNAIYWISLYLVDSPIKYWSP